MYSTKEVDFIKVVELFGEIGISLVEQYLTLREDKERLNVYRNRITEDRG